MTARAVVLPIVLVAALAVVLAVRVGAADPAPAPAGYQEVTPAERAAGLRFRPEAPAPLRAEIAAAVAAARPAARRLIAEVDGQIVVGTHAGQGDAVGFAQARGNEIEITFDVAQLAGLDAYLRRHVILHELAHAVDFTLVDGALGRALDAGVPRSAMCLGGPGTGDCADPAERVADTLAKWAVRSPGYTMALGYHVAAPTDLDAWGAPLAQLARRLPTG